MALNNAKWDVEQDAAVMAWATQQPADWQVGGRCHVYMWGSGRHGQLAETGNVEHSSSLEECCVHGGKNYQNETITERENLIL